MNISENEILFEIPTLLNFSVRVTVGYWDQITAIKHPTMKNELESVKSILALPDEIRQSRYDSKVFLFYKQKSENRFVCAVTKRLNGDGFLITAYLTNKIKHGEKIWPKSKSTSTAPETP
jgi:hypothetical protein